MSNEQTPAAEAPKKSKKMLMIIVIAAVVLLGGGGGAFFMLKGDSAEAAAPEKGVVTAIDEALTINLADGHYLKLAFSLQQTADAAEAVDTSEAIELAIDEYTGRKVAELETEKGRTAIKEELLAKIEKAYTTKDKVKEVMGIYYTQFVTQ
ncbi:flagellar basal body-associated FliL family protein [Actinoplanes sp. NPDC048796]|uniref:flagellar basal body-associated FliL family protein n=1 Tax=unclassified Actinoplanes TaxID=2626549 RepID=UPI0033D6B4FD